MSKEDEDNGHTEGEGDENGEGERVLFRKKDGVEKDGYICFPVEAPVEEKDDEPPPPPAVEIQFNTCPEDPRFQQTNKTNWCWRMFVDYHRCRHLLPNSTKSCDYFYKCYTSICPHAWVERWEDQLGKGTFPRDVTQEPQPRPKPCP